MSQMRLDKVLIWNACIFFLLLSSFVLLDLSLQLGKFHGLLFSILSVYYAGLNFLVNGILAAILYYRSKKKKASSVWKSFLASSVAFSVLAFAISQIVPRILPIE